MKLMAVIMFSVLILFSSGKDLITYAYFIANASAKGIMLVEVNGYKDHAHCLFSLSKEISISKTIQLIKGESSHWVNKNNICKVKFSWQDDYWAVSVSESHIESVQRYIQNQEDHHRKKSFEEEVGAFMEKYGSLGKRSR